MRCRQPGCGCSFEGQTVPDVCPSCGKDPWHKTDEDESILLCANTAKAEQRGLMIIKEPPNKEEHPL